MGVDVQQSQQRLFSNGVGNDDDDKDEYDEEEDKYYDDDVCCFKMTVKKTLSEFRRTHHDNWQEHRQCFTDDQLLVLTDLLVSPCYYA